uniref:Protein kinase domain-containing protein n=1 Tax=Oryza nivara TaxID=4536 RepID=A0A0E0FIM8_ORYNI
MIFSNSQLKNATKGFSEKLGEGGFGCVFKGTLPGFSVVAVKKLKDLRQGEKQFRSEVQTIGMIQHINLVHLLGFCAEGSKRLLVYEYLVNGSLNSHLFSNYSAKLTWNLRYCIAHGIAKGLAYLHEECRHCIIHCDMKPDNVLLDAEFCPKIADFGMAKLLGRDFSRALTTMRGTIGYLAPEWISGLPITHKADVYCYGMMLLEIISGRRNSEKIKEGRHTYFPIYAACKVNEGDVMCLLDRRLDGNADAEQLEKACRIACWCIQDAEDHRPMMGQVVHMLEGVTDVEVPPVPRSLQYFVGMEDNNTQSAEFGCVEVGCPSGRSQDVRRNGSTTSGMPNCVSQPILRDVAVSHLRHVNHVPEETSRRILTSDCALIATESSPRPSTTNERRLERLEPAQLNAEAGVDRERAGARRRIAGVEDAGVEGGGGANGEVCAAAEAPVVSQEWRQERHPQAFGCKQASKQRKSKSTMITTKLTIAASMNRRRGRR